MKSFACLIGLFLMGASQVLRAEDPGTEARDGAWQVSKAIVEKMGEVVVSDYPGLAAWRREFLEADKDPASVNADRLVSRNPHWWVAYYEIAPGDPALMLLHCEVLLAGGEAQRAQQLAAIYLQRPGNPEVYRKGLFSVIQQSAGAQAQPNAITNAGVELHDRGDFDGAIAKYDEALKAWPANGWTAYERGFSIYIRALTKAGKPIPKNGTVTVNDKTFDALPEKPEIDAAYAASRQHDPLQAMAYQGGGSAVKRFLAMMETVMPIWEKVRTNTSKQLDDSDLAKLADGFHKAGAHEYALATRQIVIARRKKFLPEDHPILAEHLRAIAPVAAIEQTLGNLSGRTMTARMFVPPEPGFEMLKPTPKKK